jgi:RhtB (resistance to homoserine/threonine) family protein
MLISYLPELLTVALIHLLAVMSPGPDFILIMRNSLVHSRTAGIYSAVGLALGILVHITYSLIGVGFIISQSILVFTVIKFLGAGYLLYIGYRSLSTKPKDAQLESRSQSSLGRLAAVRMGFLTNVLNPKATLFFLALFTQVISPATPKAMQLIYGLEMSVMTFIWFGIVAMALSHASVQGRFLKVQHRVEQFFGLILIAFGIKVALSSAQQ